MEGPSVSEAKERLQCAAFAGDRAYPVRADEAWRTGGVERLYIDYPDSKSVLGSIEIDTSTGKVDQVRLELLLPLDLAEKVVALVQRNSPCEDHDEPVIKAEEAPAEIPIPPTRDPGPDDVAEMVAEEQEGDGLPAEVVMPEESL